MTQYLIGLAEVKDVLRITDTSQDALLIGYLQGVTEVVERHVNEVIIPRTVVEDHNNVVPDRWGRSLSLRKTPVISLTSLVSVSGLFTWQASDFKVDPETGVVTSLPSTWPLFGDVTATYVPGRTEIPANYIEAGKIIIQHAWQTRRGKAGNPPPGGMDTTLHLSGRLGWGYAIPNAALEWLGHGVTGIA